METMTADQMREKAPRVAAFLKGLANSDRLMILCCLAQGEACVSDIIAATGIAPTSMSQHLAKLKDEGITTVRRAHRTLFYRIDHPATLEVMAVLYSHFCKDESQ
jgi:DNA-binding transcriptional ArsR family regulator